MVEQRYIQDKLFIIIGTDNLIRLHTWYMSIYLVKNYEFIIYPRPDKSIRLDTLKMIWNNVIGEKLYSSILIDKVKMLNISATEIRNKINKKYEYISNAININVLNYIKIYNLYK